MNRVKLWGLTHFGSYLKQFEVFSQAFGNFKLRALFYVTLEETVWTYVAVRNGS